MRLTGTQIVYSNDSAINDVILSHTESELIAGDESGRVLVYDLVAGKLRSTIVASPHQQPFNTSSEIGIKSLSITSNFKGNDTKYLCAANSAGCVSAWKLNDGGQELQDFFKFQAHNDYILKCEISPNNK